MIKRLISGALSLLICTMFTSEGIGQKPKSAIPQADNPVSSDMDYKISSTNSLGNYINDAISSQNSLSASASNVQVNDGYAISNIGFDDQTGEVVVKSTQPQNCTILVTILEEETNKKACEVKLEVEKGENIITTAKIDISLLPQYYIVKVELVNKKGKSLCTPFTKNTYTKEMQEIIATDIHDFDEEYVVNFDESENTNFLVLSEETVKAESTDEINTLSSADYENGIFVFENADETLKNLEEGESLFIQANENDIIAVSVDNVEINENNQIVIEGNDDNIDEMFDFIKFESTGNDIQTIVDTSVADEGVYFPDLDENETLHKLAQGEKLNFGYRNNKKLKFEYNKTTEIPVSVETDENTWEDLIDPSGLEESVTGTITATSNIYLYKKDDNIQVEFNLELLFNMGVEIGVLYEFDEMKINDLLNDVTYPLALKLCNMRIVTSIPGIIINISPKVVLEISGTLKIDFSFGVKLGFTYDSTIESEDERFHNNSETIPLTYTITAEGSLTVKFVLDPTICFISDKIAYVQFELSFGFKYSITGEFGQQNMDLITNTSESGNISIVSSSDSEIHACEFCVSGQIDFVTEASINASILKFKVSLNLFEFEHPIGTAHFSNEIGFGLGECTYNMYKVRFNVYNGNSLLNPLKGVIVEMEDLVQTTDLFGNATFYGKNSDSSSYPYTVKIGDEILESGRITINSAEQAIYINVEENEDGSLSVVGSEKETGEKDTPAVTTTSPIQNGITIATAPALNKHKIIESLKLGEHINSILYDNGEYWIYGYGDMNGDSLDPSEQIWLNHPEKVTKVIFEHEDEKNGLTINSIGNSVFKDCKNLPEITIPKTVTRIGKYAFQNCSSLKGFNIPSSVKVIEDYAFANTGYVDVVIPSTVTTLGDYLFSGSTSLKTAVIEDRASLPNFTFNKCISLEEITLPYAGTTLESVNKADSKEVVADRLFGNAGVGLIDKIYSVNYNYNDVPNTLKKITIAGGTRIPSNAFDGFKSVTEFVLPDTITSIGDYAFSNCSSLPSNPMPSGVKIIGNHAYDGCKSLKTFTVPSSVETIGSYAFANCTGFTSITVPETIVTLGNYAFSDCTSLKKAEIKPVGKIGDCIFNRCISLEEIALPYAGTTLESVNKADSKEVVADRLFGNAGVGLIDKIYSVNYNYNDVPNTLKKITIAGGTRIPSNAFDGFKSVTEFVLPDTITSIGLDAFDECEALSEITIYNPDCEIYPDKSTIPEKTIIYGYKDSTAESYALEYDREFKVIESNPDVTTPPTTTTVVSEIKPTLYGDANCDGHVSIADVSAIFQWIGNPDKYLLSPQGMANGDCFKTGSGITLSDALAIQMYDAKLISNLPVSELPVQR